MRGDCPQHYFHVLRLCLIFLITQWHWLVLKNQDINTEECQARNKRKSSESFSCCDPTATGFGAEQLWNGRGDLGTSSHVGKYTVLFSDLLSLLARSLSLLTCLRSEGTFEFFENKRVMKYRELLPLMFLHQYDKIWYRHILILLQTLTTGTAI